MAMKCLCPRLVPCVCSRIGPHRLAAAMLLAVFLIGGCATDMTRRMDEGTAPMTRELSAGYSLLLNVVEQQKQVDGVLFIMQTTPATKQLVKDIATTMGAANKRFDEAAQSFKRDGIDVKSPGLGAVEAAAREEIAERTTKSLLLGKHRQRDLLLSQAKSMSYVAALANDLSKRDTDETRIAWLKQLADDALALHHRASDLLIVKKDDAPAKDD